MKWFSEKAWSPYIAGVIIGLLQIPVFKLMGSGLGASAVFPTVAGWINRTFYPTAENLQIVASRFSTYKNAWYVTLVVGVMLGAFLSSKLSGVRRNDFSPIWKKAIKANSRPLRFAFAFIGGFIMVFGARLAAGCTSGHGITGLATLNIISFVVIAVIFATAFVAALLYRKI